MKKQEKQDVVADLKENFSSYKCFYITDTSTLTAIKTNELRRMMFKGGVKMTVAKNTLIRKAMEGTGVDYGQLFDTLKGSSSLLFSADAKAPAKIIKEFRKKSDRPFLKGAFVENDVFIGDEQLDTLLKLKSKEELVGEIIGMLQAPARNVISALQASSGKLAGIVKALEEKKS